MEAKPYARQLPPAEEMHAALARRDSSYEGVFFAAIRTTGIFCRPGCPARTPNPENVLFVASTQEALAAGYRPCKRCCPMQPAGETPTWLAPLLAAVEEDRTRRWRDRDLTAMGLEPRRVSRWFQAHHGTTFHAYQRARRLGLALGHIRSGASVTDTALDAGFESESGFREAFEALFGAPPTRLADKRHVPVTRITSPLGPLLAAADDRGLLLLEFTDRRALATQIKALQKSTGATFAPGEHPHFDELRIQLDEYFAGQRRDFDLPLDLAGSPFQLACWRALQQIPCGETRSYGEIAEQLGRPGASRAVGTANGQNRIAILVPCHRVIKADGTLSGYGGGLWRKHHLLELEQG